MCPLEIETVVENSVEFPFETEVVAENSAGSPFETEAAAENSVVAKLPSLNHYSLPAATQFETPTLVSLTVALPNVSAEKHLPDWSVAAALKVR